VNEERVSRLRALENRLGHRFDDLALLDRALTHASRANEEPGGHARHNEPLEFLGDSVLGFLVADLLHRRDPDGDEGTKTKIRAHLVSAPSLARRSVELGLPDLILLGRGEERSGGRKKEALWVNAYEAVIAAVYVDGGIAAAQRFVGQAFGQEVETGASLLGWDYKSVLQERLQARGDAVPEYQVVAEDGPSHRRRFRVSCLVRGEAISAGEGPSKKAAQQAAAREALERLGWARPGPP
jgi:ribonuclease-3